MKYYALVADEATPDILRDAHGLFRLSREEGTIERLAPDGTWVWDPAMYRYLAKGEYGYVPATEEQANAIVATVRPSKGEQ